MKYKLLLFISLVLGVYLRFVNLPSRVPFDWDQERDMQVMQSIVQDKKPTLVGPVVRGEGGFLLGPLYTYLLLPGFIISGGSPLSAPVTNIILDLAVGVALFLMAPVAGAFWLLSPLVVGNALVAWNVGLIPLWSLTLLYLYKRYASKTSIFLPTLAFFAGLSWHIHASLIPLAGIFLAIYFFKNLKKISLRSFLISALCYLLPLSPLILFDLRHEFVNFKLLKVFLSTSPTDKPEAWIFVITEVIKKLGTFLSSNVSLVSNWLLGWVLLIVMLWSIYRHDRQNFLLTIVIIALVLILLIIYRDPFIPTYYFLPLLLPLIYFFGLSFNHHQLTSKLILLALFFLGLYSANYFRDSSIPFSLQSKEKFVQFLKNENLPLDLRYELSPGRGNGFSYLLSRVGVRVDSTSSTHAVLKDTASLPNKLNNREPDLFVPLSPYQLEIYRPYDVK